MQAVILAGGLGTRMRPLTWTRPKPLLPVVNVPMVRRIIDELPEDVDRVVLAASYKLDQLQAYFDQADVGREVVLVEETDPLGTGGGIKNVEQHLDGPFFVLNGDVLSALDLDAFRRFHREQDAVCSLALYEVSDPRAYGVVEMDGSRIKRFVEKPETIEEAPSNLVNAGTYIMEPEVLDHIEAGKVVSVERATFPKLLSEDLPVHGFPFEGTWVDCGRPETFLRANRAILQDLGLERDVADGVQDDGARYTDWVVVGRKAHLGRDAEVERSVLLDGVVLGEAARVKETILGEGAVVEKGAALVGCVLGDGARVKEGVVLKNVNVEPGDTVGDGA